MPLPRFSWPHLAVLMALCAILIAGCSQAPETPPTGVEPPNGLAGQGPGDATDPANKTHFASGWLNSTTSRLHAPGLSYGHSGDNCVHFEGIEILEGWLTAEWSAPLPMADEMRLHVSDFDTRRHVIGPSPLELDVGNLTADSRFGLIMFLKGAPEVSADVEVTLSLHWEFTYRGPSELTFRDGGCS